MNSVIPYLIFSLNLPTITYILVFIILYTFKFNRTHELLRLKKAATYKKKNMIK